VYDLAVIGGGINGCGIARDAAGRGLKVFLCDQADLGGATSSASSKLIHGGLRYLEQYQFQLVSKSLRERETLLKNSPHLITPLRFLLPHHPGLRPAWLLRAGLLLYDALGGKRSLSRSRRVNLAAHPGGATLKAEFSVGFEYADCWVDDARLVIAAAADARRLGAVVETRTHGQSAARVDGLWDIALRDACGGLASVRARALVNATGPWVGEALPTGAGGQSAAGRPGPGIKLVQGSHIVVKKWYPGEHAYILQNRDCRVVFVIPFERDWALIGTTEVAYHGDPAKARITPAETDYLCATVGRYFTTTLTADDVVWSYSGVRPLYDDGDGSLREATRDYSIRRHPGPPPMVTIYGGKLTTFRRLAEAALAELTPYFPAMKPPWTAAAPLPGGEPMAADEAADALSKTYPFLPPSLRERYLRAYAGQAFGMLGDAACIGDLGRHFGHGLYEIEAAYLVEHEWAGSTEDILWRRTKLGLRFDAHQAAALDQWLATRFKHRRVGPGPRAFGRANRGC